MKKKISIAVIAVIILISSAFFTWLYLKPIGSPTFSGFVRTLRRSGCSVKDVTSQFAEECKFEMPDNQKVLNVNGHKVYVTITDSDTLYPTLQKDILNLTNPLINFIGMPHLYREGTLIVKYFGSDEELLKVLKEALGNPLVN